MSTIPEVWRSSQRHLLTHFMHLVIRIALILVLLLVFARPSAADSGKLPTVAVLYFENNSKDASLDVLSKGFADMLITDLSASQAVVVVEREKLQALLKEAKLQRGRFFDRTTAVKIGRGLGAQYVISGAFVQVKPQMRVDVRMIEVSTSKVILAAKVRGNANQVFQLEQNLVGDFLRKLNHKFFSSALPPTKVPNLASLLSYSKALALADQGRNEQAAAAMKRLVQRAPAFGLARAQYARFLERLEESSTRRDQVARRQAESLFSQAAEFLKQHRIDKVDIEQAKAYLAYRTILGIQISAALHKTLQGHRPNLRALPRRNAGRALSLMRALYENQRLLIEETETARVRLGDLRPGLSRESEKLADSLKVRTRDSSPTETMLRFLLRGEFTGMGAVKSYYMVPALGDLDPKMKRAALLLAKNELIRKAFPGGRSLESHQVRILELLANWHIDRGRVQQGIEALQKILDRFPKIHNWDLYESKIKKQLGLEHDHTVGLRQKYRRGLAACDAWNYNIGASNALSSLSHSRGLGAILVAEKQLRKACKADPKYSSLQKVFYQDAFLLAASLGDCEWFDLYVKKWISVGGSKRDAEGYRKNYSNCRTNLEP